ncbi:unnamed protein product [Closterium sp. NIES-53]
MGASREIRGAWASRGGVPAAAAGAVATAAREGRGWVLAATVGAAVAAAGEGRGGVTHGARGAPPGAGAAAADAGAGGAAAKKRLAQPGTCTPGSGPLPSPLVPPIESFASSPWTHRSPLSRAVSPEPRRSRYHANGPFHLVLRSHVPPPPVLLPPPDSSLTVFPDPLYDYLHASCPVVSRVLPLLVTHLTTPPLSVSALVASVAGFLSSHRLDYASHLVSGTARSPSTRVVPVKRPPGSPPVFKARGFSQRKGVDFFQISAPTMKMTTLCVLLHIVAHHDYELHSLDFSTAFLQGSLHEQIWPRRLPGFTRSFLPKTQWQLRRPVYGLRKAPREWHETLRTTLAMLEFFPSSAEPSFFVCRGSTPFFNLFYIDDLDIATPDRRALASVKEELQRRHTCSDLGELQHYLGPHITWDRAARTITLTQSHMAEQVLTRFRFPFSRVQLTPLAVDHGLTAPPSNKQFESRGPYLEVVGCLMYLMTCTRPGLAYLLSVLAHFVVPGRHRPSHWYAVKRVAKYVASTGMGLVLGGLQPVTLTGFSDSTWVDDAESLRSTQGYYFSLGTRAFSWRLTHASSVSISNCESEVYAEAMAAQKLCWLPRPKSWASDAPRLWERLESLWG